MAVFMLNKNTKTQKWTIAHFALHDAYTDFILSRQAMQCTIATLKFYENTAGKFLSWVETQSITSPPEITARHVRAYLAELTARKLSDWTVNDHARAIRTLLKFFHAEGYMSAPVKFDMPKVAKKRLPVLTASEVDTVVKACTSKRNKAIILVLVDTGLRSSELTNLTWGDVDFSNGLTKVIRGKGRKDRSVVIGATTRRALLAYRRLLSNSTDSAPLIQNQSGRRFTGNGLSQIFKRLKIKTGIHVNPHALRRTFVILSLRAGIDPLHLQALLGHAKLDMVMYYAQMVDDDLLQAHKVYSPIDNLSRLK
jgi:site-specific recombinase XerD